MVVSRACGAQLKGRSYAEVLQRELSCHHYPSVIVRGFAAVE